jgi:hypothetical protein
MGTATPHDCSDKIDGIDILDLALPVDQPFICKNLCHRDFRIFSTQRMPAWRNGLHHLNLRYFIYKMMYKTPTYAEHQHYNRPFSSGQLSAFIIQTGNWLKIL